MGRKKKGEFLGRKRGQNLQPREGKGRRGDEVRKLRLHTAVMRWSKKPSGGKKNADAQNEKGVDRGLEKKNGSESRDETPAFPDELKCQGTGGGNVRAELKTKLSQASGDVDAGNPKKRRKSRGRGSNEIPLLAETDVSIGGRNRGRAKKERCPGRRRGHQIY